MLSTNKTKQIVMKTSTAVRYNVVVIYIHTVRVSGCDNRHLAVLIDTHEIASTAL